ncbi:beta-lactamase domain protein [Rippkaea orientalis PCC 8801]|uniref:Beta-lactamase domain protein n=1 Tax=Rippkaea orientalis (strain PCC 8801 / RF-1) TaxID=41431 RepID=B7JYA4_RIPO1|nr:MBL fold metallo-hydrolase [Rippkaea orientalis]ACK67206.1 beta-lactamase domain protein [Rippkaea orientalis PCC 8801]
MSRPPQAFDQQVPPLSCFPYGVGHAQEGICLQVQMGHYRILLDCGLSNLTPLVSQAQPPVDMVFCSHAHADHARGLLALHQAFRDLPIYASEVTAQLLPLNWPKEPSSETSFCQPLKWRSPLEIDENLTVELFRAGHLPGASAILLSYQTPQRTYKLLYTGDFSLSNLQLVEGLSVEALRGLSPDILIIEGSYGTGRHPHRRQQEKHLMQRIYEALSVGQSVLLPVPTLGLGQEILKLLRSHHQFTGRDLDIWVDGNVAKACDIYLELLAEFPPSVQNFAKHQSLFWDERICPRLRRLTPQQRGTLGQTPCIVLTDNLVHLHDEGFLMLGSWLILMPEHEGLRPDSPEILALNQLPLIHLDTYLLAEHSDGRNTTQLIHNLRPQHIIFVHGSPMDLADLTNLEELRNRYQLHSPAAETLVELPIGDRFIQPDTPSPTVYEGEVNEFESKIQIALPGEITQEPRWRQFADTGLVEARWQGDELVLRGVTQRELLAQSSQNRPITDVDCCLTCRHYRGQRCWNSQSPLYGFKVTPEGYCPVFEPEKSNLDF